MKKFTETQWKTFKDKWDAENQLRMTRVDKINANGNHQISWEIVDPIFSSSPLMEIIHRHDGPAIYSDDGKVAEWWFDGVHYETPDKMPLSLFLAYVKWHRDHQLVGNDR